MDYDVFIKICQLYDRELELLDESNQDMNNREIYNELLMCHNEYKQLLGNLTLSYVYEKVRGLDNPVTISLYFEEAEELHDDYEKMIPIYKHALEGCRMLYGDEGEKTIECLLQIAVCVRSLCEEGQISQKVFSDELGNEYSYKMVLEIVEELFLKKHDHPLYGTWIANMLCDEYVREGRKQRALDVFKKWSRKHSIENIGDAEELHVWIEYSSLLAELGYIEIAKENVDKIYIWIGTGMPWNDSLKPYLIRRVSEIYVSCTLYQDAVEILQEVIKAEEDFPAECKDEFFNVKAQLAHCYHLNGNEVEAAMLGFELQRTIEEEGRRHPSGRQFNNILANIIGKLGDHQEQYDRLFHAYTESKRCMGENNEETILYEMNLGLACLQLYYETADQMKEKYINDAEQYLSDAYEHSVTGRGKDNLFSLLIQQKLAEVKAENGDIFEAIVMMKEVWQKNAEVLSEDNPETADAKLRYAVLCLETQQVFNEIPEWIEEVDPEPILKECFLTKTKYLGLRHWETIDALYWYTRAVQSNELINLLAGETSERSFQKSLELHKILLKNISGMLEQAFYINSIEKQNEYLNILENEFSQIFWLLLNSIELNIPIALEEIYGMIAGYKNLCYDMQRQKFLGSNNEMRSKLAATLSVNEEILKYIYGNRKDVFDQQEEWAAVTQISESLKAGNEVYVDIWQEANDWNVFLIDHEGIRCQIIEHLSEEEIPDMDNAGCFEQPRLDDMVYTFEETVKWALFIAEALKQHLTGYEKIYMNLHKQLNGFPIEAYLIDLTGKPVVSVASIEQMVNLKKENKMEIANVGFLEPKGSFDREVVKPFVQSTDIMEDLSEKYNIICASGHGIYEIGIQEPESKRNYIDLGENSRIYIQDIISCDLAETELVILPICQSGTGKNYEIFGNYSLGMAFRIAGAGYTIETLWEVPLSAAVVFEYEFFRQLMKSGKICDAFCAAIRTLKKYTADDLKKFCGFFLKTTGDRRLSKIIYSEISNGMYPFEEAIYWAGFCLWKGK